MLVPTPILVVGLSTRAIAESAVRSGYGERIVTLDYFGDRDQQTLVKNYALKRDFFLPFSAQGLLQAGRHLNFDALVYISNLENHPDVVMALAQGRTLLGNTPETLQRVRDWEELRRVCRTEGIPFPTTLLPGEETQADPRLDWLRKPWRSGGGHSIRRWEGESLEKRRSFLQAYRPGRPASVAFVADGHRSVVIGLTEQLIGRPELGAHGFTWCGNVLPLMWATDEKSSYSSLLKTVQGMADRITRRFGLRGLNGMDLVVSETVEGEPTPWLIEVNPRYTASMELIEWAYGLNLFSLHLNALNGHLPDFHLEERLPPEQSHFFVKAILYTRETVTVPDTARWVERGRRDVPHPGEVIAAGHPVCTVLTDGASWNILWHRLMTEIEAIRREIGDREEVCSS